MKYWLCSNKVNCFSVFFLVLFCLFRRIIWLTDGHLFFALGALIRTPNCTYKQNANCATWSSFGTLVQLLLSKYAQYLMFQIAPVEFDINLLFPNDTYIQKKRTALPYSRGTLHRYTHNNNVSFMVDHFSYRSPFGRILKCRCRASANDGDLLFSAKTGARLWLFIVLFLSFITHVTFLFILGYILANEKEASLPQPQLRGYLTHEHPALEPHQTNAVRIWVACGVDIHFGRVVMDGFGRILIDAIH